MDTAIDTRTGFALDPVTGLPPNDDDMRIDEFDPTSSFLEDLDPNIQMQDQSPASIKSAGFRMVKF